MRRPVLLLTASLVLMTAALIAYRIVWLGYPVLPLAAGRTWQLLITAQVTPQGETGALSLAIPAEDAGTMVVEEHVVSGAYAFGIVKQGPNRVAVWSGSGLVRPEAITYRATIHARPVRRAATQSPLLAPYPPSFDSAELRLAEELGRRWQSLPPVKRFQAAASVVRDRPDEVTSADAVIRQWQTIHHSHDRTEAALALFRASDLPARAVEGIRLAEEVQTLPTKWIAVWTGREWANLNPETGEVYPPSAALLPLAVGGLPAATVAGAQLSDIRWSVSRQVVSQWKLLYERIARSAHFLDRWSLLQLPPEFQGTFRILLLVPLGALIVSIIRNIVGLPTFGVFTPLLIALAFRSTGTFYGVAIFSGILLIGYVMRSLLDRLHLLLVPRLSVILTLVIGCFTLLALAGNKLGLRELMAVGLIPFVILTMTIERFFIIIEESGAKEALLTAAGSVTVAVMAYRILSWEPLQLTFFVYPELILTVAALQILVGRYTGYRLSELYRFRNLGGPS